MLDLAAQPIKRAARTLRPAAPSAAILATASVRPNRLGQREPGRRFAKIVAVGFWATFISLVVAAAATVALALLFLLPLLGLGYLLACLIALSGDRNVESISGDLIERL